MYFFYVLYLFPICAFSLCPNGWTQNPNSDNICYLMVKGSSGRSWDEASADCASRYTGSELLWFNTKEEKDWILSHTWQLYDQSPDCKDCNDPRGSAWIGLARHAHPGDIKTTRNNASLALDFFESSDWNFGHPGDKVGYLSLMEYSQGSMGFRIDAKADKFWHFCKLVDWNPLAAFQPSHLDWIINTEFESCYLLRNSTSGVHWNVAEEACRSLETGSHLLWIDSTPEKEWVQSYKWKIKDRWGQCNNCPNTQSAWIGMQQDEQGKRTWSYNNQKIPDDFFVGNDWYFGHPKNGLYFGSLTDFVSSVRFRTDSINTNLWFICKKSCPLSTTVKSTMSSIPTTMSSTPVTESSTTTIKDASTTTLSQTSVTQPESSTTQSTLTASSTSSSRTSEVTHSESETSTTQSTLTASSTSSSRTSEITHSESETSTTQSTLTASSTLSSSRTSEITHSESETSTTQSTFTPSSTSSSLKTSQLTPSETIKTESTLSSSSRTTSRASSTTFDYTTKDHVTTTLQQTSEMSSHSESSTSSSASSHTTSDNTASVTSSTSGPPIGPIDDERFNHIYWIAPVSSVLILVLLGSLIFIFYKKKTRVGHSDDVKHDLSSQSSLPVTTSV